ncbi:hypothetical protein GCM10023310_70250 [Paenibacillus vulneris]|uniref:Uncharacterized protein n=1 Tax=Paenibacillus vulneris TaxID=1133364 RepID=A0ABW3UGU4_9BACL
MANIDVYYDYYEEGLSPKWMFINFGKGKIDWAKNFVYVPIEVPFQRKTADEFIDIEMCFTVTLSDLVVNSEKEGKFGISLRSIQNRANLMRGRGEFPYLVSEIESFILQICDIEEVLAIDSNDLYAWR